MTTKTVPRGFGGRLVAAVNRDPATAPHAQRNDRWIAVGTILFSIVLALLVKDGKSPDALGWALLIGSQIPLVWRRSHPMAALAAVIVLVAPYHALDYTHLAPVAGSMVALYTAATIGGSRSTVIAGFVVLAGTFTAGFIADGHGSVDTLRIAGWIVAVLVAGAHVRGHRQLVASTLERAERAEQTREEEAARRVVEERLRIARDLHDLLAHSITLIGVQTSVASHILAADPDRLDREAVARTLDEISETCRTARAEVRTTLEVLRDGEPQRGPLPDLTALPDLARTAGAELDLDADVVAPPAVAAAAYRIVQEALTNSVRHAGLDVSRAARVNVIAGALHVTVIDDGGPVVSDGPSGFGLIGMRERARTVGGTLTAGPRPEGGFQVTAVLPLLNLRDST